MKKEKIKVFEEKLKKEREKIIAELKNLAQEEKGSWKVKFPKFNGETSLEGAEDEVEEYSSLLPIKADLEKRLKEIERALEKIKTQNYGICEKCKREIEIERLNVAPETRFCKECAQK